MRRNPLLIFVLVFASVGGCFAPLVLAEPLDVLVLTDAAGLGDKGFNDVCWQGVQRAEKDFDVRAHFLQSREQADYVPNLSLAAKRADVVVTLGYLFVDAVRKVTPHFPDTRFIHIEGDISGDNVAGFDFRSEQGGFLAGVVAGLFTKSRKVGAVTGMDIPPVEAYVTGFRCGVAAAEKHRGEDIETVVVSAGSFDDPVKGKSLAQALIRQGVDVIFRAAGNTGVGVTEAVKSADGVYMVAEDLSQDHLLPGKILTSALKRMDVAVYGAIEDIVHGRFNAGHHWLGAQDGAIDITEMKHSKDLFSGEQMACIQKARKLLKEGRLEIPKRQEDLDAFEAPDLGAEPSR